MTLSPAMLWGKYRVRGCPSASRPHNLRQNAFSWSGFAAAYDATFGRSRGDALRAPHNRMHGRAKIAPRSAHRGPGAVGVAAGVAARHLGVAVDVDRVGVGPALQ